MEDMLFSSIFTKTSPWPEGRMPGSPLTSEGPKEEKMNWVSGFRCLNCGHSWLEMAPDDIWEMVREVASPAACPLCGARMQHGQVELISYQERNLEVFGSCQYDFNSVHQIPE